MNGTDDELLSANSCSGNIENSTNTSTVGDEMVNASTSSSRGNFRGRNTANGRHNYAKKNRNQNWSYVDNERRGGHRNRFSRGTSRNAMKRSDNNDWRRNDTSGVDQIGDQFAGAAAAPITRSEQALSFMEQTEKSNSEAAFKNVNENSSHSKVFRRNALPNKSVVNPKEESDETQREMLETQLRNGEYECMVCCEEIKLNNAIWNCGNCYNIFHLKCIKQWAFSNGSLKSSANSQNSGWRCPACQNIEMRVPNRYYCFCGKVKDPDLNRYLVPHSCGNICRKKKVTQNKSRCTHNCNIQCHPGPCPPCQVKVSKSCCCGKSTLKVKCEESSKDITCNKPCNKLLDCGQHRCPLYCHPNSCADCAHNLVQRCYCGQKIRTISCTLQNNMDTQYSCNELCGKLLDCKNHRCEKICHPDVCDPCSDSPSLVTHCPCGKTEITELLNEERKSCTDVIPTCGQKCEKSLICGPKENPHKCVKRCHKGPCSVCGLKTIIKCKCGANSLNVDCKTLVNSFENGVFTCKRRCNKKLSCGRHKCLVECCTQEEHTCTQVCGRKLSCNLHVCEEVCHKGSCRVCWNVSWEDLTCHCGASVVYPPIACGTKPPECHQPCRRRHDCDHRALHTCHNEESCPPCTELVPKLCFGGHEELRFVPCYMEAMSCGKKCSKTLSCGVHTCPKVCHVGDCGPCALPCPIVRSECGHTCAAPCHQETSKHCPNIPCKAVLQVHCNCGRKTDQSLCYKVNESSRKIPLTLLASINNQSNDTVDVMELLKKAKENKLCQLECDERCSVMERNRKLAEALNIAEADLSPEPGLPNYSESLKQMAKENPTFMTYIYESLTNLVKETKQSKLSFKNLNFPPMRSDQRQALHELCEFFGCKSHAVDREPHRSVIVKALKEKCYLPTANILDVVKQEEEKRNPKASIASKPIAKKEVNLTTKELAKEAAKEESAIDYFDFVG